MSISINKAMIARKLSDVEGKTVAEISKIMGVKAETVTRYLREIRDHVEPKEAKILLFDVETAPMEIWSWGIRDQYLGHFQIKEEWFVISWAAKWLFGDEIMFDCVTPAESLAKNDMRVLKGIHDLFEEANVVVAHNAARFDVRKLNYRFITHGYFKPSPYSVIDTLKQAQKHFAASSHKLDHLTKTFGLSQKEETNFQLWVDCCEGSQTQLDRMMSYNISDVNALEGLYLFLRPWMTSHPNVAMLRGIKENACANCGSTELDWSIKNYPTPSGSFRAARCMDCGAICRSRFSAVTKEERASSLVSVAR